MTTQKDIAAQAGVSVSLVSRVLSGTAPSIGISAATAARIQRTADAMGYRPNWSARLLKGAPARTFGVVVYDFEDPFLGRIVGELQRAAHAQDFSLVLGGFENRRIWDLDVTALLRHQIDGLIIIGGGRDVDWIKPFSAKKIPLARVGGGPILKRLHSFEVDEQKGLAWLVDHLRADGRRRIAFAGAEQPIHRMRQTHYQQALQVQGPVDGGPDALFFEASLLEAGYEAGRRFAARPARRRPDAVIAANDMVALGVLRAFAEAGVAVPDAIAVTGYDDLPVARMAIPSLTTVRQPIARMARAAFDRVAATDAASAAQRTIFDPEPVVRESAPGPAGRRT